MLREHVLLDKLILVTVYYNHTATTEIYTLSYTTLFRSRRVAIPRRSDGRLERCADLGSFISFFERVVNMQTKRTARSDEHTSELPSQSNLVCRLLLEKKKRASVIIFRSPSSLSTEVYII